MRKKRKEQPSSSDDNKVLKNGGYLDNGACHRHGRHPAMWDKQTATIEG